MELPEDDLDLLESLSLAWRRNGVGVPPGDDCVAESNAESALFRDGEDGGLSTVARRCISGVLPPRLMGEENVNGHYTQNEQLYM